MITATYSDLRANLKGYLDRVVNDSDNILVNRGGGAVVIMSLDDYESMVETAYVAAQPGLVDAIRQGDEDVRAGNYEIVDIDAL